MFAAGKNNRSERRTQNLIRKPSRVAVAGCADFVAAWILEYNSILLFVVTTVSSVP